MEGFSPKCEGDVLEEFYSGVPQGSVPPSFSFFRPSLRPCRCSCGATAARVSFVVVVVACGVAWNARCLNVAPGCKCTGIVRGTEHSSSGWSMAGDDDENHFDPV